MKWSLREWVYIAVFGALWGAVEIGLGSYLHILFPPLANTFFNGLVLGFIGITIALIGRQFVPRGGALFAIGIITALLKLLSFGGVKLGPVLAILAQSLLMEIGVLWHRGQRRGSYTLAGALAIAWNTVHPFIMLPLLFGRTISEAYVKLVQDGSAILGLNMRYGLLILGILLLIRLIVGSAAGWLAWDLGRLLRLRAGQPMEAT